MFKDRTPEAATIFWGGTIIVAGLALIVIQVGLNAACVFYVKRFEPSPNVGIVVLIVGAAMIAVAFVAHLLQLQKK